MTLFKNNFCILSNSKNSYHLGFFENELCILQIDPKTKRLIRVENITNLSHQQQNDRLKQCFRLYSKQKNCYLRQLNKQTNYHYQYRYDIGLTLRKGGI